MIKSYINKVGFAALLMSMWQKLKDKIGGKVLFSGIVGLLSLYTGTLLAKVDELQPGYCKVIMRHWFWLGNPFGSIHAFALGNLAGNGFWVGIPRWFARRRQSDHRQHRQNRISGSVARHHDRYLPVRRGQDRR